MTRQEIENSIYEAKEYSDVFAAIVEILQQLLDAGVGADSMTVLSKKRGVKQASQNNDKKEEDKTA